MCLYLFSPMTFLCLNSKISLTNANLFCSPSCCHHKTSQTGSTAVDSNRPEHHRYPTSISDIDVRRGEVSAQRTGHQETAPFRSLCCCNIRRQSSFFPQTARLSNSSSKLNLNSPDFTVQPRVVEYICCLFLMCRQKQERNLLCFLCYSACKRISHQWLWDTRSFVLREMYKLQCWLGRTAYILSWHPIKQR